MFHALRAKIIFQLLRENITLQTRILMIGNASFVVLQNDKLSDGFEFGGQLPPLFLHLRMAHSCFVYRQVVLETRMYKNAE